MMNGSSMSGVAVGVEASEDMKAESSLGGGEPVILNIYDMFWTNEYTGEQDAVLFWGHFDNSIFIPVNHHSQNDVMKRYSNEFYIFRHFFVSLFKTENN